MESTSYAAASAGDARAGTVGGDRTSGDREIPRIATRADRGGTNVAAPERVLSVAGGAALAIYGARRKDWLGGALALVGAALVERGTTGHCPLYQAMGVSTAEGGDGELSSGEQGTHGGHGLERKHGPAATVDAQKAIRVERAMSVDAEPAELYRFWRNFENLPRIMQHLESVTVIDDTRSHWKAKAPAGSTVEWDAVIVNDLPNELIAWKSVSHASVANAGSVHFRKATGGRGTVVRVVMDYEPPAGRIGALIAKLFGEEPDVQVREDLRRFKAMMESGELPTTEGQSSGREPSA